LVARYSACSAESKDLKGAYLTHAARSFSTTEARTERAAPAFKDLAQNGDGR
jgi:hypothetical protein